MAKPLSPGQVVERICRDVAEKGLAAVLDYTARIDKAQLTAETVRVPRAELERAHAGADADFLQAIRRVRENIRAFQEAILHRDVRVDRPGGYLEQRYGALDRVGICVPGGAAAYPSSVLMTAVPAQVAGVKQLAVVAPPTRFGAYNADMLATCHELGIGEVYRLGGAQAVAALAYGVEGIPRVDKIVGPGNLFVALAKKFVYGEVDIDSIAGPSEVVVIVDDSTRPEYTAFDLIAQAEHAPGASVLIGWDAKVLEAAVAALERQLSEVERGELARQSLEDYRRGDSGPRRGRGLRAYGRDRPGASAHCHGRCRAIGRKDPPRRRDIFGQLHAGGLGRLRGRPVACAAYERDCAIRQRVVVQRFFAKQQCFAFYPRRDDETGSGRASDCDQRRIDRAPGERGNKDEG